MFEDWSRQELLTLAAIVMTFVVAIIGLVGVWIGRSSHVLMNSRLSQLLAASVGEARGEGAALERAAADARQVEKQIVDDARGVAQEVRADAREDKK